MPDTLRPIPYQLPPASALEACALFPGGGAAGLERFLREIISYFTTPHIVLSTQVLYPTLCFTLYNAHMP
jgi:hypothetical protein